MNNARKMKKERDDKQSETTANDDTCKINDGRISLQENSKELRQHTKCESRRIEKIISKQNIVGSDRRAERFTQRKASSSTVSCMKAKQASYLAGNMAILVESLQAPYICRFFQSITLIPPP